MEGEESITKIVKLQNDEYLKSHKIAQLPLAVIAKNSILKKSRIFLTLIQTN